MGFAQASSSDNLAVTQLEPSTFVLLLQFHVHRATTACGAV